mgnify:CR=1 FL=1
MRRKVYDPNSSDSVKRSDSSDDRALKKINVRISEIENDLRILSSAIPPQTEQEPQDSGSANRDIRWHCKKCGYLLAFYDKDHDVMRTRYKEHIVYMRAGVGGFIQIVCRGCSEVNTQEYVAAQE